MPKFKCGTCAKPFKAEDKKAVMRFCSRQCFGDHRKTLVGEKAYGWRGGGVEIECAKCKKKFFRPKNNTGRRYCSSACRLNRITRPCHECGNDVRRKAHLMRGERVFCNHHCHTIFMNRITRSYSRIGQNRPETAIEKKIEAELIRRGIAFDKQHNVFDVATKPDFFIAPNIAVYCDGDYWHRIPKNAERDLRINAALIDNGYVVHRFWEKDIHASASDCVDKVAVWTLPLGGS